MAVRAVFQASCLLLASLPVFAGTVVCHDAGRYRVVARPTDSVGTDFLVQSRGPGDDRRACNYMPRPGDLEIRNESAEYFLALRGSKLLLDSGTAPEPRGLIIWDLDKRAKVYAGTYSSPYRVDRTGISFWMPSGEATESQCPQAAPWRMQGLGAALETQVRLNFADLKLVPSRVVRCSPRQ